METLPFNLQELQFATTLDHLGDALLITDLTGNCIWFNHAFKTLLKYTGPAGFGLQAWAEQLHLYELNSTLLDQDAQKQSSVNPTAQPAHITQARLGEFNGSHPPRLPSANLIVQQIIAPSEPQTLLIETLPLYNRYHSLSAQLCLFKPLNPENTLLLSKPVLQDEITGLGNRAYFTKLLETTLRETVQHQDTLALFILDLDRFKSLNDGLGHQGGDQILKMLATRLLSFLPQHWPVVRLGGDEFAIIVHANQDTPPSPAITFVNRLPPLIQQWAERLLEIVSQPLVLNQQEIFLTTSIGISLFPQHGQDAHTLLKHSEIALYRAKELGGFTYQIYQPHAHQNTFERLGLETHLRHALARNQFEVFYQPQITLHNNQVIGYEALLRWQHPTAGRQSPANFIPILEETGLIDAVGIWLIESACCLLKKLKSRLQRPLKMAVNLSARQFNDPKLSEKILLILQQQQVQPEELELEITESVLMSRHHDTLSTLQALTLAGVRLSIDDFGTGYSSLAYLKRFPIDTLKINKSFIADIERNEDDAAIVKAIIAMAKSLDITVVAEGVENAAQMNFLLLEQCDIMQGFWISRPIDASRIIDWTHTHQAGFKSAELHTIL